MKRGEVLKLTAGAMLAALYVVFSNYLTVNLGIIKISLESLPVMLAGFLFGSCEGALVGLVGSLIGQLTGPYGFNFATSPVWMSPYIAAGAIAGLYKTEFLKNCRQRTLIITFLCQMAITILTLAATWWDAFYWKYPAEMTTALIGAKLVTSVVRTVLFALIIEAVLRLLKKSAAQMFL